MQFIQQVKLTKTHPLDVIRSFHDKSFIQYLTAAQPVRIESWNGIDDDKEASFSFWFFGWRKIKVVHKEKNKEQMTWECNPYWTKVHLDINNPKLKNYLTLAGKGKRIELGAFLSPDERLELRDKIQNALAKVNSS